MEVSAKTKDHPEEVKVEFELPETLEGLVEKFGSEVVTSNARGAIVIGLQSYLRRHIDKPQDELQSLATAWVPGTRSPTTPKSAFEKASGAISQLSAEERMELLRKLQAV